MYVQIDPCSPVPKQGYATKQTKCGHVWWVFGGRLITEAGTLIFKTEMADYLDAKGITEVELDAAIKMWAAENEADYVIDYCLNIRYNVVIKPICRKKR